MRKLQRPGAANLGLAAVGIVAALAFGPAVAVEPPLVTASASANADESSSMIPTGMNLKRSLSRQETEVRYQNALNLEARGEMRAAVEAYRQAADNGHGMAQKKLGDIYGTGKGGIERDYVTSLRWYQKTRAQGIAIPRPFTYPGVRRI